jgi:hypothetical protein
MSPAVINGQCRFRGRQSVCQQCRSDVAFRASIMAPDDCPHSWRLGDLVASIATPIARALKLPCIDPATNDLRPESGCAKRKAWMNGDKPRENTP